jgi:hypothetical protein
MFNNAFNRDRKDPLVDSIKSIMEDTGLRNRAEGLVCEAFGVFNRNALSNEQVADFVAACADAYGALKEGVQIDEISKGLAKRYIKKSEKDEGRHDLNTDKGYNKFANRSNGQLLARDKLNKTSDGYTGKPYAKVFAKEGTQIDELFGKGRLKDIMDKRNKDEYKAEKAAEKEHDSRKETDHKTGPSREDKALGKAQYARERANMTAWKLKNHRAKTGFKEETQINEISNKKKGAYLGTAVADLTSRAMDHGYLKGQNRADNARTIKNRQHGIANATKSIREEEQINETPDSKRKGYRGPAPKGTLAHPDTKKHMRDLKKKYPSKSGPLRPFNPDDVKEETQIDELSKGTLKSYVRKATNQYNKLQDSPAIRATQATPKELTKRTPSARLYAANAAAAPTRAKMKQRANGVADARDRLEGNGTKKFYKMSEESLFEELYININEQAIYALENGYFDQFADNLTEEQFDFLDEEMVNELSAFGQAFRNAGGKNFTFNGKSYSGARADGKGSSPIRSQAQKQATADASTVRSTKSAITNPVTSKTDSKGNATSFASNGGSGGAASTYGSGKSSVPGGTSTKSVGVGTGTSTFKDTVKSNIDAMHSGQAQASNDAANMRAGNSGQTNDTVTKTDSKGSTTSFAAGSGSGGAADRYGSGSSSVPGGTSNKSVGTGTGSAGVGAATGGLTTGGAPSAGGGASGDSKGLAKTPLNKPTVSESVETPVKKGFVTVGNMRIKLL